MDCKNCSCKVDMSSVGAGEAVTFRCRAWLGVLHLFVKRLDLRGRSPEFNQLDAYCTEARCVKALEDEFDKAVSSSVQHVPCA
jgi:hypothetical protein